MVPESTGVAESWDPSLRQRPRRGLRRLTEKRRSGRRPSSVLSISAELQSRSCSSVVTVCSHKSEAGCLFVSTAVTTDWSCVIIAPAFCILTLRYNWLLVQLAILHLFHGIAKHSLYLCMTRRWGQEAAASYVSTRMLLKQATSC